jgi:hypothetical protein
MAYTIRGKACGYSNVAVGSATGRERLIAGAAATSEKHGGGMIGPTVGTSYHSTNLTDNISVGNFAPAGDNPATTPASS